jgi:hypothetical protein
LFDAPLPASSSAERARAGELIYLPPIERGIAMRTEFMPSTEVATEEAAWIRCPWAAVILIVDGGWRAWESEADAETWLNQV